MASKFMAYLVSSVIGAAVIVFLNLMPMTAQCCFIWGLLGGFIAILVFKSMTGGPAGPGPGFVCGLLSGLIALLVAVLLGVLVFLGVGSLGFLGGLLSGEGLGGRLFSGIIGGLFMGGITGLPIIVIFFFQAIIWTIFSVIGGLLGGAFFGGKK